MNASYHLRIRGAQRRAETPRERLHRTLRDFYPGLTIDIYEAMVAAQGGACARCGGRDKARLCVDYDREAGTLKRLLCRGCTSWKSRPIGKRSRLWKSGVDGPTDGLHRATRGATSRAP